MFNTLLTAGARSWFYWWIEPSWQEPNSINSKQQYDPTHINWFFLLTQKFYFLFLSVLIDVLRFEFYLRLQSICCDDDFTRYFCMWFAVFADFDEFVKWKRTVFVQIQNPNWRKKAVIVFVSSMIPCCFIFAMLLPSSQSVLEFAISI